MAKPHNFSVPVGGDVRGLLKQVEGLIAEHGGSLKGDQKTGEIVGKTPLGPIKGQYRVENGVCSITITDKPMLAPMKRIEDAVRGYFSDQTS